MMRNPYSDGASLWVLHAARHLRRRAQQERELAPRALLHEAKLTIVHARIAPDFREVSTDERQMMTLVDVADEPDPPRRLSIADAASQRVARIRRVGDDATGAHDFGGAIDEPALGVRRVNLEQLRHDFKSVQLYNE